MAPVLVKSLNRLNRASLIDLALKWLDQHPQCEPYLSTNRTINESDEEDYLFPPADSVEQLRQIYRSLRKDEAASKQHIIDRIVSGDWRRGLSLHQHASIDFAYLAQNDTALRWSALRLVPLDTALQVVNPLAAQPSKKRKIVHRQQPSYPTISPASFLASLKSQISPLVKAYYTLHRLPAAYNLSILRIYISPRTTFHPHSSATPRNARAATDSGRIIYIALPESCPFIYISLSGAASSKQRPGSSALKSQVDIATARRIIMEAIPKATSRPHERWAMESTKLITKSLRSICELRGNGKGGTAGGVYSKFVSEDVDKMDTSPVDIIPPCQQRPTLNEAMGQENDDTQQGTAQAQRKREVEERFGTMLSHHAPLDRVHIQLKDLLKPPDEARSSGQAAPITMTFVGSDCFRGFKELAENLGKDQLVDLGRMPGWMTGQENRSGITA